jgi:hypothetical protein
MVVRFRASLTTKTSSERLTAGKTAFHALSQDIQLRRNILETQLKKHLKQLLASVTIHI